MRCTEHASTRLEAVPPGTPVNLLAEMQRLSLEIAAVFMFSLETAAFGAELRGMVTHYLTTIGRSFPGDFLLPRGMPTLLGLRRQSFRRRWKRLIGTIIRQRQDQARTQPGVSNGGALRDLFDPMAAAHGKEAEDLLADEVATMIVAGHETTALLLFWACWLLAQMPDWQDAVAEETAGLDLSPAGAAASLSALARTRAVVQETLRLYPPAFMTARLATRPNEIAGVAVPAGAVVLLSFWLLHRDPRQWQAPDSFDPERFLTGREPDRFAFLPFGTGPHVCIGAQLATVEATLALARLVRGSQIRLAQGEWPVLLIGVLSTRPDYAPQFLMQRRVA